VAGAAPSDVASIDAEAFARELTALRTELGATFEPEDLAHFRKIERWSRLCTALGYVLAWLAPNPLSVLLLAHGSTTRWTIVAHHAMHHGYDRVPGVPQRYTGRSFAIRWRRFVDWLDWILPVAWSYEHNVHHLHTGERADPDLVEENVRWLRRSRLPLLVKYAVVAFFACTWKLIYYAPNTFQVLRRIERRRAGLANEPGEVRYAAAFNVFNPEGRNFWRTCVLPYAAVRFGLIPALFAPLGEEAVLSVLVNSLLAELLTNIQSFFLITPSHAGGDVHRFEGPATSRAEFQVRQVMGTVNYTTGSDLVDFLHGWVNYQIEHHLWPDLPLRRYQQLQPRVQALCAKHGVPYVQQSVLQRARKLIALMVGQTTMRVQSSR
jgi:fatty acid desaturase